MFRGFPDVKQDAVKALSHETQCFSRANLLQPFGFGGAVRCSSGADNGWSVATEFTRWIWFKGYFPHACVSCIVMKHPPGKSFSMPCEDLNGFHRLKGPDHAGKSAKDACLFSCRHSAGRGRFWKETAVARGVQSWIKDGELAFKLMNCAGDEGFAEEPCGIRNQKPGRKVVRAVKDQIVLPEESHDVVLLESFVVDFKTDIGVQVRKPL